MANEKPKESAPVVESEETKALAAERAELEKLRAELAADRKRLEDERQLLDEESKSLEESQQIIALNQLAEQSGLPPTRVHTRDVPKGVNRKEWMAAHGKKAIVRDWEVTLRGKGRPKVVSPIVAVDESEAINLAYKRTNAAGSTQACNPIAREITP